MFFFDLTLLSEVILETVSQAEFARMENISRARVSQWVKNRTISLELNGKIDPEKAGRELDRNRDAGRRLDYELRTDGGRSNSNDYSGPDGPPHPFTGNIMRDMTIISLTFFYEHYLNIMAPILMKIFTELCHVNKECAGEFVVCFGFKTHEIIKELLERDLIGKKLGTDFDHFYSEISGRRVRTSPPKDFQMEHPETLLKLLRSEKKK
jgi:hypothetical protein